MTSTTNTTNPCSNINTVSVIPRETFVASLSFSSFAMFLSLALIPSIARAANDDASWRSYRSRWPRYQEQKNYVTYLTIVDTGSPFLTAPPQITAALTVSVLLSTTNDKNNTNNRRRRTRLGRNTDDDGSFSYEQYGMTLGRVDWKIAPWMTLIGNGETRSSSFAATTTTTTRWDRTEAISIQDEHNIVVRLPSEIVQEVTGGIFVGLVHAFVIASSKSSSSSSSSSLYLLKTNDEKVVVSS